MSEQDALKSIRNKNLSDILQVLRKKGDCSLSTLADNTDGGLTTVKKCVNQAIEYGMIIEGDTADSTGGRKAKQYLINEKYQYFLFLIVDNNEILGRIFDFKFTCVKEISVHIEINQYYESLCKLIDILVSEYDIGTVCLSIPCVVKDGRIIDWYYNSNLIDFDIKSDLEQKYKINVIVQNDMKLSVIGESENVKHNVKNIVTVQFGHNGIGVGEMANGHVLEGSAGFAGEVSFINDLRKNIMGISYPAKILRNVIICINPEVVVFYKSERQNQFGQIFNTAVRGLPKYAIPRFEISDDYIGSIINGLIFLINKKGFFRKPEEKQ
ncbi:MAG: ROK family protein [Eubacterium sp.]